MEISKSKNKDYQFQLFQKFNRENRHQLEVMQEKKIQNKRKICSNIILVNCLKEKLKGCKASSTKKKKAAFLLIQMKVKPLKILNP